MSSPPQQDPYKVLGITKGADLAAVKRAYRQLVLKCHPDKFQDEGLKAIKVDEFHKVQQAYDLLSDESKRSHYDEQVKLYELRKEMGGGGAPHLVHQPRAVREAGRARGHRQGGAVYRLHTGDQGGDRAEW